MRDVNHGIYTVYVDRIALNWTIDVYYRFTEKLTNKATQLQQTMEYFTLQ